MVGRAVGLGFVYSALALHVMSLTFSIVAFHLVVNQLVTGSPTAVTAEASAWLTGLLGIRSAVQFLVGRYLGAGSDTAGRKPILVLCALACAAQHLVQAAAADVWILSLAMVFGGVSDAFLVVMYCWLTDIEPPQRRSQAFSGALSVFAGFGFVLGLPAGAVAAQAAGAVVAFLVSAALGLAAAVAIAAAPVADCAAPRPSVSANSSSSLIPPEEGEADVMGWAHAGVRWRGWPSDGVGFLWENAPWKGMSIIREGRGEGTWRLWAIQFCFSVALYVLQQVYVNFSFKVWGLSPTQSGSTFAALGLAIGVVPLVLIPRLGEIAAVYWSCFTYIAGFALFAVAGARLGFDTIYLLAPCLLLTAGSSSWSPAMRSLITKLYAAEQQGVVQGVLAQLGVVSTLPALGGSALFSFFISADAPVYWPGAAFAYAALWMLPAAGLLHSVYGPGMLLPARSLEEQKRIDAQAAAGAEPLLPGGVELKEEDSA